jgi:hypothetical protein
MKKAVIAIIASLTFSYGSNGSGVFVNVGVSKGAIQGIQMDSIYYFNFHPVFQRTESRPSLTPGMNNHSTKSFQSLLASGCA